MRRSWTGDLSSALAALVFAIPGFFASAQTPNASSTFKVLQPEQLVFYNADHSPFGAYSSFVYGLDGNRGQDSTKPVDLLIGSVADGGDSQGPDAQQFMPLVDDALGKQLGLVKKESIRRLMSACTDSWKAGSLSWVHYTPAWFMPEWETATAEERKRLVLPATWMEIQFDNTQSPVARTLLVGLAVPATKRTFSGGQTGFVFGSQAMSVAAGTCQLLETSELQAKLHAQIKDGFAFALKVPPGQKKTLVVTISTYQGGPCFGSDNVYYYTKLFSGLDDVIAYADRHYAEARARSLYLDKKLQTSGQNSYRQFLAGDALHSYLYNMALLSRPDGTPLVIELEGEYVFLNTFDLTVDHVFYQLAMYPWVTRNILDQFAAHYSYLSKIADPLTGQSASDVISFTHDMGQNTFSPPGKSSYERDKNYMSQEELQNWILCAGLYWKKTGDTAWLTKNSMLLAQCLRSMLLRDAINPAARDGLTSVMNEKGEITTYDALDDALLSPRNNVYVAVKSWASYLALEVMFNAIGETTEATTAQQQALRGCQTLTGKFDQKDQYIPALLDGKNTSRIIPAVEGLIYPAKMGLNEAVSPSGPYGPMIQMLRAHLDTVLQPGVCLDATSGAWKLSSTSNNTWQSKVYLAQYIAENILGIKDDRTHGHVDAVHATFEVMGTPATCWSDQLDSTNGSSLGSNHYPRGITSCLWWLDSGK